MRRHHLVVMALLGTIAISSPAHAKTTEYDLTIDRTPVSITGKTLKKVTANGGIPAPTLRFVEGDEAIIRVTNKMKEDTSIHWHGLLLPGGMDGVPGFNDFLGIPPGETFTYRFKVRQTGTYWYHAHSMGQEQDGLYGSIIIAPPGKDPIKSERDYVVVLSDFTEEESDDVMMNLKMSSDYYSTARRTLGDFFDDVEKQGFDKAWKTAKEWGDKRTFR